jgi:quinol-cytochrome oxidoreductase complex cytochrome b subunit
MRESLESMAPRDAPPAFRWWTFGILIAYTASLLVFCGVVTVWHYSPTDALRGRLAASNPPHLPIASFNAAPSSMGSFNVAHVELGGTAPRWVCYQMPE